MFDGFKTMHFGNWWKQRQGSDFDYNLDQPGVVFGEQRAITCFMCPPFT